MNTKVLIGKNEIIILILVFALNSINLPVKFPINGFYQELIAEETKEQPKKELPDLGKPQQNQEKDIKSLVKETVKKFTSANGNHCNMLTGVEFEINGGILQSMKTSIKGVYKKNHPLGVEYGKVFTLGEDENEMDNFFEYYSKIEGNFFVVKSNADENWQKNAFKGVLSVEDELTILLDKMKDEKITGEEKINEKNCQVIESPLNTQGLPKILAYYLKSMLPPGIKIINPSWKIWIGKEDGYLYKSIFTTGIQFNMHPQVQINGVAPKPYLGVQRGPEIGEGVKIEKVLQGTPAEKSGLKDGDIITHFGNKKVTDWESLQENIDQHKIGDEIKLKILRNKEELEISVKLVASEEGQMQVQIIPQVQVQIEVPTIKFTHELNVSHYNENTDFVIPEEVEELLGLTPYLGVKAMPQPDENGLVIEEVTPGSPADKAGLKKGQLISEVAGKPVKNVTELRTIIKKYKPGDEVKIKILNPGNKEPKEITVTLSKHPESD